jgi:hypothetical protein
LRSRDERKAARAHARTPLLRLAPALPALSSTKSTSSAVHKMRIAPTTARRGRGSVGQCSRGNATSYEVNEHL